MPEVTDPSILAQFNGGQAAPAAPRGPVFGPAKVPDPIQAATLERQERSENRQEAQNTFRVMAPEEVRAKGLPVGGVYQINGLGEVKEVSAAPKTGTPESTAENAVKSAGIDLLSPDDRVAKLILKSTSGGLETMGANAYGFVTGDSTDGMIAIGELKPLVADLVLQATGGSLGSQISDGDRKFIIERMGNIADPEVPADQRLASWNEVKRRLASSLGVPLDKVFFAQPESNSDEDGEPFRNFDPSDPTRGGMIPPRGGPSGGFGDQLQAGVAQGFGDIVQGVGDTVGLVTDPFARLLADTLGYDGSQMQSLGTNLREGVGLPQNQNETAGAINRFASGAMVGGLTARAAAPLAEAGSVAQNALMTMGRTPIRDTIAGGAAGGSSQVGQDVGGTLGAVVGTIAGGLGGYSAANALARTAAPRVASNYAQASARQGVDMLPADAGGPVARAVTTGTRASPISVGPVVTAAERQQRQFGQAVQRTAASQGEVVSTQEAGELVQQGAQNFTRETAKRGSRMYDRAAQMARGVKAIRPTGTVEAIDAQLARLAENPAAEQGTIEALQAFRARVADGVSIQGLRDARSTLSQGVYDGKLRSGGDQAMWKGILANVADDIDAGLRSVGRENAANAFRAADKFWSERVEFIDKALQPIVGRDGMKGGEEVLQALEGMARGQRGGNARLSRVMAALSPEEAGNVRATLVDRLGRATPGSQDAQGEVFSPATFLTNWNRMTPQAKASLFPDKAARDNINDLALIAERAKRGQAMANTSNTGIAVTSANLVAGVGGAAMNLPLTLLGGTATFLTGKLMASPGFARVLAKSAKLPPEAANRTFREQLGVLATREPALQSDINALLAAANDNARLAAEEGNQQQR